MRRRSHSAYPEASGQKLALPRVPLRYRNLNLFPFRHGRLRHVLGPTYPRLTTHCRRTLAPSTEGILTPLWLLLPPGSATANGPLDLTAQLPPERRARLPPRVLPRVPGYPQLAYSRIFSAHPTSPVRLLRSACPIAA